nr:hypothetical protein [Tanacetum cinerariifolium]
LVGLLGICVPWEAKATGYVSKTHTHAVETRDWLGACLLGLLGICVPWEAKATGYVSKTHTHAVETRDWLGAWYCLDVYRFHVVVEEQVLTRETSELNSRNV